jgi:hypothetical protein
MAEATGMKLKRDDRAEMVLIPLCCNKAGRSSYSPYKEQWHVHFNDENGNHYYLFTTSEAIVKQAMENVNKPVNAKFIVAGLNEFDNCVRIKNVRF